MNFVIISFVLWAIVVCVALIRNKNICDTGAWLIFWSGIIFCIVNGIVYASVQSIDPNNWKTLCVKQRGTVQAYKIPGSNSTEYKCTYTKGE